MKHALFFILLLSASVWSCRKDFVVEDIDDRTLTVNAPANNAATTINLVTFWWEPLDGAEKYNLQIVKPDFSAVVQLIMDTNIAMTKFNYSLKPGSYQWRIKGINAGHSTAYQVFNLKIDTTSDLSEQVVNLISPANGAVMGNSVVTFKWGSISVAKKYRLQIDGGLTLDTTFEAKTALTYTLSAVKNGTISYSWNVKAINELSESEFGATPYKLTIDLKGPSAPVLSYPAILSGTMTASDSLKWIHSSDTRYDSVYVAWDSLFTSFPQQLRADISTLPVSEFQLSPNASGAYYWWKVRSFDAYGNASAYSFRQKFRITP